MTVLGTRPEIIRLSRVISVLDSNINHILVHTGQNYDYELNEIFFNDLQIRKPDYFLAAVGKTVSETIGQIIINADRVFECEKPDALLILGDTNSSLVAIPAKRRKIPIFHMEAGNRCFDCRVPEEINRKIVDHISDINLPYSDIAREYLLRENFPADRIIKVGSPMYEVLSYYEKQIDSSTVLNDLGLEHRNYFLASFHREENIESDNLINIMDALNGMCDKYNKKIIVTTHPRTKKQLDLLNLEVNENILFYKPFGFFDYVHMQKEALVVLSDSGTITEEASILNFLALNLRSTHERPEGMEEASVVMSGVTKESILRSLEVVIEQPRSSFNMVKDYSIDNVSCKILRIIVSYIDYVNTVVWRKHV